jgi:DNA (cytosine-5)-methyltransferase 1
MIYGSVCSGIEAASVAWHPLGWRASFLSEIEPFPRAVLAHHYPDVPLHGDFTTIQKGDYAAIDLLVGGTPCQSFSVAGLRKGLADPRGNLMLEFGALARRLCPVWLVWENVPGVLSSNGGRDFGSFLGMLGELGYGFAYRVLDAQYFGVAQRRRRVFVVGCIGNWRAAAAVLFERESLSGNPAPRRQTGQEVTPTIRAGVTNGGKGHGARSGDSKDELIVPVASTGDVSHCLNAGGMGRQDYETETLIAHTPRGEGFDASEDGTGRGTPLVPVQPYTLAIRGRGDSHDLEYRQDGTANALLTPNGGRGGIGVGAVAASHQVRRLTPRECERLQGFPDDYTAITLRGKAAADGPRYKALGNSMAVPVMHWIGSRIQQVDAIIAPSAAGAAA